MSVDRYTTMTTEEMRALAKIRGIPLYKIEFMVGENLANYLRDDDLDRADIARWEYE